MSLIIRHTLVGGGIVVLQWLVLGRLQFWGAFPDVVLLYVALMGLRYGRLAGSVSGFALGFLMDAIYDTWGIQTFVKTLVGFLIGLLHNGLLAILFALQAETRTMTLITVLWLGSALYTAAVGTLVSSFAR